MSNVTTGHTWFLDTVGLIYDNPICIREITIIPNAAGDSAVFYYYDPSVVLYQADAVITTTSSGVVTATGKFTTARAEAYGVIKFDYRCLTAAGAASANQGVKRMIVSRDSDNQITLSPTSGVTDEAAATYYWTTHSALKAFTIKTPGTEAVTTRWELLHSEGIRFPNLVLGTLTSGAKLEILV